MVPKWFCVGRVEVPPMALTPSTPSSPAAAPSGDPPFCQRCWVNQQTKQNLQETQANLQHTNYALDTVRNMAKGLENTVYGELQKEVGKLQADVRLLMRAAVRRGLEAQPTPEDPAAKKQKTSKATMTDKADQPGQPKTNDATKVIVDLRAAEQESESD